MISYRESRKNRTLDDFEEQEEGETDDKKEKK